MARPQLLGRTARHSTFPIQSQHITLCKTVQQDSALYITKSEHLSTHVWIALKHLRQTRQMHTNASNAFKCCRKSLNIWMFRACAGCASSSSLSACRRFNIKCRHQRCPTYKGCPWHLYLHCSHITSYQHAKGYLSQSLLFISSKISKLKCVNVTLCFPSSFITIYAEHSCAELISFMWLVIPFQSFNGLKRFHKVDSPFFVDPNAAHE